MKRITLAKIEAVDKKVQSDKTYGKENELITSCLNLYPGNTFVETVAMKIGLIDIKNPQTFLDTKGK